MRAAITLRRETGRHGEPWDVLEVAYSSFFDSANIRLVPVPNGSHVTDDCLAHVDALVLSGGNDLHPQTLGSDAPVTPSASLERDETELRLLRGAMGRGLPVLGICRGLQLVNAAFGGGVEPDLSTRSDVHRPGAVHPVSVTDDDAARLFGLEHFEVNSFHCQSVTRETLAGDLRSFAMHEASGVVEGLFHPTRAVAAIQYHPERRRTYDSVDLRLVTAFRDGKLFWECGA